MLLALMLLLPQLDLSREGLDAFLLGPDALHGGEGDGGFAKPLLTFQVDGSLHADLPVGDAALHIAFRGAHPSERGLDCSLYTNPFPDPAGGLQSPHL